MIERQLGNMFRRKSSIFNINNYRHLRKENMVLTVKPKEATIPLRTSKSLMALNKLKHVYDATAEIQERKQALAD